MAVVTVLPSCRMFAMMAEYDLVLAHPSICSDLESQAHLNDLLKRQPTNRLRYTMAVDILAPLFHMPFFQDSVIPTLQNATYGMASALIHFTYTHTRTHARTHVLAPSLAHSLTHLHTRPRTPPLLIHTPTHLVNQNLKPQAHSLTHSLICSLTHLLTRPRTPPLPIHTPTHLA